MDVGAVVTFRNLADANFYDCHSPGGDDAAALYQIQHFLRYRPIFRAIMQRPWPSLRSLYALVVVIIIIIVILTV